MDQSYTKREKEIKDRENHTYQSEFDYPYLKELEQLIQDNFFGKYLKAYHYTKSPQKGFFRKNGLKPLDTDAHLEYFSEILEKHNINEEKREDMKQRINHFIKSENGSNREGMIHFTLHHCRKKEDAVSYFLNYFGGEIVSMPLENHDEYFRIIKEIGIPTVVIFQYPFDEISYVKGLSNKIRNNYINKHIDSSVNRQIESGILNRKITPAMILEELSYSEYKTKYLNKKYG